MKKYFSLFLLIFANVNVFADKLLVIENDADLVSLYNIDKSNGQLTKQSQASTLGSGPASAITSPDGNYLFILNGASTNIARFSMSDIKSNNFKNGSLVANIGLDTWGAYLPQTVRGCWYLL